MTNDKSPAQTEGFKCRCCSEPNLKNGEALCDFCFKARIEDTRHQCESPARSETKMDAKDKVLAVWADVIVRCEQDRDIFKWRAYRTVGGERTVGLGNSENECWDDIITAYAFAEDAAHLSHPGGERCIYCDGGYPTVDQEMLLQDSLGLPGRFHRKRDADGKDMGLYTCDYRDPLPYPNSKPEAAPAEAIQDPLCVICDSPICYPSANGKYYCSQDKPSWQEEEIEVSYEPKPESPQAEGEKSEQRQELDSMLKYLRRIVDFGGYDGYGQDDYLCKIADRLENEFKSRTSEQALHIAWRKRAEEAEAKIEPQPSSLAGMTEEFPLRTYNNFFGVPSKHYAVCLREDVLKLAKQSQPVIEPLVGVEEIARYIESDSECSAGEDEMTHDHETFPHALSMYLTRNNTATIIERGGMQIGQPEIEAKIQDFLRDSQWEAREGARDMSESKRKVELPPLDRNYWGDIGGELGCREVQLRQALQRISYLEAELQTVLDRAERYMDLCGEKDKEIERLKVDLKDCQDCHFPCLLEEHKRQLGWANEKKAAEEGR